jgi:hypothetical protein
MISYNDTLSNYCLHLCTRNGYIKPRTNSSTEGEHNQDGELVIILGLSILQRTVYTSVVHWTVKQLESSNRILDTFIGLLKKCVKAYRTGNLSKHQPHGLPELTH